MRDAPVAEVEATIAGVTWPEQKAPRIQAILRRITERVGSLPLDLLSGVPLPEARAWLEELLGAGPKTSAAVLSFSILRQAALLVDSHHHRVAVRTSLIPANVAVGLSHAVLSAQPPEDWDAQQVYDNQEVMMLHGQGCRYHQAPTCDCCVLLRLYPSG